MRRSMCPSHWGLILGLIFTAAAPGALAQDQAVAGFSAPEQITSNDALETSGLAEVNGERKVITIEENTAGPGNHLVEYTDTGAGYDRQVLATGDIFSLSPIVQLNPFVFTVVYNFEVYLFVWDPNTQTWAGTQLTNTGGNVASATLSATGTLLTIALLSHVVTLWEWTGSTFADAAGPGTDIIDVATGFGGGKIPRTAEDPSTGDRCTLFQRLSTGALVASCLIGAVLNSVTLADLPAPTGFNVYIETAAVFLTGYFFFSYLTTNGDVHLARISAATLAATVITLGVLPALAAGDFPTLAMAATPGGQLLLAWAAAAVLVNPETLVLTHLIDFPLLLVGALVITLIGSLMYLVGPGSTVVTSFDPAAVQALDTSAIPVLQGWPLVALAMLLAATAFWWVQHRRD